MNEMTVTLRVNGILRAVRQASDALAGPDRS